MQVADHDPGLDEAGIKWFRRNADRFESGSHWITEDKFDDVWVAFVEGFLEEAVLADYPFPASILVACAGKPILKVIDHVVTRERYGPADVVERAFWDDEAQVSVFEVRRATREKTGTHL